MTTRLLRGAVTQLSGLFVDDLPFAAAIVVWVAALWLLQRAAFLPDPWPAVLMFAGLAGILVGGALRRAAKSGR